MITDVQDDRGSIGTLMSGIVDDCRDLVRQELLLARQRFAEDMRKTREGTLAWAIAFGVFFLSGIAFCLMFAHALYAATSPATDPAGLPMWACYGIVGVVLAIVGGAAFVMGRQKFESIRLVDGKSDKEASND